MWVSCLPVCVVLAVSSGPARADPEPPLFAVEADLGQGLAMGGGAGNAAYKLSPLTVGVLAERAVQAEPWATLVGGFFVEAFASAAEQADENKDRRVSMLEAYKYASGQVARTYENDGKMLTEHALLDDNGDRQGTPQPDPVANDGALARSLYITGGAGRLAQQLPDDPELRALDEQRQALEERIDQLKLLKGGTDPALYEKDLEKLLVELALKSREIRELEAKKGVRPL
jgi:hypothetical protein